MQLNLTKTYQLCHGCKETTLFRKMYLAFGIYKDHGWLKRGSIAADTYLCQCCSKCSTDDLAFLKPCNRNALDFTFMSINTHTALFGKATKLLDGILEDFSRTKVEQFTSAVGKNFLSENILDRAHLYRRLYHHLLRVLGSKLDWLSQ